MQRLYEQKSPPIDFCAQYWNLARQAIKVGILTDKEAKIIGRIGTRKQSYWTRHYRNLVAIVGERAIRRLWEILSC